MTRRPNILFVMADQLAPQVLPAYGGRRVQTLHLDRLAAEGAVFENAYCNFPLCAPARFSMLSGRLPSRIGAFDNAAEFAAISSPIFERLPAVLRAACASASKALQVLMNSAVS